LPEQGLGVRRFVVAEDDDARRLARQPSLVSWPASGMWGVSIAARERGPISDPECTAAVKRARSPTVEQMSPVPGMPPSGQGGTGWPISSVTKPAASPQ